ncbi:NADP-dependent phosphogluconate dehydrogenase [Aestuariirhabdus litorea]|uniref:6-phosphogluconate dehydrogenase, decarboxylating n=1 Tax=Aestuariirhabdus litorea TaxID=2528527 RepID=A0A3P3VTB5_9GAMM|nr:NADP-dependent phosphogluconate dehydrogenase [Aestuariirhabdus litorea]RRJ84003.1 NADP-dependent phosphogluconate dehydrogenase [Aestuariirhabdus litorea]RWW97223.1 NADP-dependent phosphogluconate dehydrogenase [Endozoicomonadaceae bacterium GTF-13]
MNEATAGCDIGLIGAGVMGKSLTLNLADHGYRVAVFDRDPNRLDALHDQDAAERGDRPTRLHGCSTYPQLLAQLPTPRIILLSIPAGKPVDEVCQRLIAAGIGTEDIVVDTGNSLWSDSQAREQHYRSHFIFFSTAVSGGEVGARFGPSLMPSGCPAAWSRLQPIWEAIAAKVDPESGQPIESRVPGKPVTGGEPCAAYIGPGGSGHYVKMVHNGIEYADMQMICEAYQIMRDALGMQPAAIAAVFAQWNRGVLNSYLIEISAEILATTDADSGLPLVDIILDKAGQKGTGLWTAVSSLQLGIPAPSIAEAVAARSLSALKPERMIASGVLAGPQAAPPPDHQKHAHIEALHDALYCAKLCVYAQGFQLMRCAAREQGWTLNFAAIASIWRAGCIIRARFLHAIREAFACDPDLQNLLLAPYFAKQLAARQHNWRQAVAHAALSGIPIAALGSALSYYDAYRTAVLPANLLQAQRDFFGAHRFERIDRDEGTLYHCEWSLPGRPLTH